MKFDTNPENNYDEWKELVVKNNDGSDWHFVANHVITSQTTVGDEETTLMSAEPWAKYRVTPEVVLRENGMSTDTHGREKAVEILGNELQGIYSDM